MKRSPSALLLYPLAALTIALSLALAACGSESTAGNSDSADSVSADLASADSNSSNTQPAVVPSEGASTFTAEVWADNWFALYANGELVGEDSVPITTERSFNAETISFEASYPLTLAIEAKDFKETDSGIEYIGEGNQQMGDGGLIAQITDTATGQVVATTGADWSIMVIHRAPLNTECEKDPDPDATCQSEILTAPTGWADSDFDDSGWNAATVWSEGDVSPKDGYDEIDWNSAAQLVWGSDLEIDNTVLLRLTAG